MKERNKLFFLVYICFVKNVFPKILNLDKGNVLWIEKNSVKMK